MIKIFSITKYSDESWTGGYVGYKNEWEDTLNNWINEWQQKMNVVIDGIEHSTVNDNIQHGSSPFNVTRKIIHVATIHYHERGLVLSQVASVP